MQTEEDKKLIEDAFDFSQAAHVGQLRKYTGDKYFSHCSSAAMKVHYVGGSAVQIAAALLHDTVEDTEVTLEDIQVRFGQKVASLVEWLTDVSTPEDGNRAARKKLDREHLAEAPPEAKTIKLADLIDNTSSIVTHAPEFAKVYMAEKKLLLEVLQEGDPKLLKEATKIVEDYYAK